MTTAPTDLPAGVPLGKVLQPYEVAAVEESDGYWRSYTLECWTPPVLRGSDWPPPGDREQLVRRGAVVECIPRTDPPADTGGVWLIVLDNAGTATSWREATDGTGAPPIAADRPSGLLCREYVELPAFAESMANLGEPPWNDDKIAYQFVLAYWFLEGQPARMDVDANGVAPGRDHVFGHMVRSHVAHRPIADAAPERHYTPPHYRAKTRGIDRWDSFRQQLAHSAARWPISGRTSSRFRTAWLRRLRCSPPCRAARTPGAAPTPAPLTA